MARRHPQFQFKDDAFKQVRAFGGSYLKGSNPKSKRPISTTAPMHLVLRSSKAKQSWSMRHPRNFARVNRLVERHCRRFGVRLHRFANVGNHLHLLVKVRNRFAFKGFLRALSGAIAMLITGARKGEKANGPFWDARPFSRVVFGRRGYRFARDYVILNELEAAGLIHRKPTDRLTIETTPTTPTFCRNDRASARKHSPTEV